MPKLRNVRNISLLAHAADVLDDEEYVLLYDLNRSTNLELPYWTYYRFDLLVMNEDECKSKFRFLSHDIYRLIDVFGLPEEFTCYNGVTVNADEALCIFHRPTSSR